MVAEVSAAGLAGRVVPGWFSIVIVTQIQADPTTHDGGVLTETCPTTVANRPGTRPTTLA